MVCTASSMAISRDSPTFTPASAKASTISIRYAGPLPDRPVTASRWYSSTTTTRPTRSKMAWARAMSSSLA